MGKKTIFPSFSVLAPAYIYNVLFGFLPAIVKSQEFDVNTINGPFRYQPILTLPFLLLHLFIVYWLHDSIVRVLIIKQYFLWVLIVILIIQINYLFVNWIFSRKDYIRIFNEAHRLLGRCRRPSLSHSDVLLFLSTYGYILKPIVLPENFANWLSINMLIYVRMFGQLSVESVACATMRAAEVVLCDLNRGLDLGHSVSLHEVVATRLRVYAFVKSASRTIGTLYCPILLVTVIVVITGNLYALKPMLNDEGVNKVSVMYLIEWSSPLCSMFIVCRRSHALFVQSRKTKRCLQAFLLKRGNNFASTKLVIHILKLIDENNIHLKAGESLEYDTSLWLMMMNLVLTNMLALLPASRYMQ